MNLDSPKIIIVSGPNGSGKSTLAPSLLRDFLNVTEYVNADTIAMGLSAYNASTVAIQSGRIAIKRMRFLASTYASFAFETTLAARSFVSWIHELKTQGYEFHLLYLWLQHVDIAIQRVKERVRLGGHDIPEDVIRQRYERGRHNFFNLYKPLASSWGVFDNSEGNGCQLIASGNDTHTLNIFHDELWDAFSKDNS